ncbi:beta-lactamase domain protein [Methanocaldococcus vulcanius M7]|uniref:Beta-lactamase domain protein n=1 Tax=Methanocaldococcus vulcanius (strain ATCC 700851 / DSM 12094 / M7) TaxID=579137 RepID=C9RHN6_METVM|nr:MBL fold metallo-hydrolase [Methanocaldococcus vulcanius]ACX73088.1 beta-lactamase domain protein [Methanocaldococcus vulcanius M7]
MVVKNVKIYVLGEDYAGYNSPFLSQHGLSFLIKIEDESEKIKNILFDVGTYAKPILFNMKLLHLDPQEIDAIILSHSHVDHTGGVVEMVKAIQKNPIPIFAHPHIFKTSFALDPEFSLANSLTESIKKDVERSGGRWILSSDPIRLIEGVSTLGEIKKEEQLEFEKTPTIKLYYIEDGRLVEDRVEDEIGLYIETRKGLIIVSGCSHPGIVSMIKKAIHLSGVNKVYAVIGGFHLIDANEDRINKTIAHLKKLGVERIYTGHCTGFKAEYRLSEEFGERFERLHAGKVIEI